MCLPTVHRNLRGYSGKARRKGAGWEDGEGGQLPQVGDLSLSSQGSASGWRWASELQRILFLAEAEPSGDSREACLFLLLEFCAGA